ncbi:MAG: ABC-2 type transport system ATP-binding protein [Pseudoalteromonas tetraodonis]|jgi:ABC-2 type transport system ATP-binding protein
MTDSATDAIKMVDLRVDYGDFAAVDSLSLTVPFGEVFGLVGPNGAGKTSSFKVLATLMEPTFGEVFLCGIDIALQPEKARRVLGYMPDLAPVPSDLKCWEFLDLYAAAHGLTESARRNRISECLEKVDLEDKREAICSSLSRGMKQRLVLAKTLLHRPKVMVLDEPASGMDPVSRVALRRILKELAAEGRTVIVSSHILSELSDMCTSVGFMSAGKLVDAGATEEVLARQGSARRQIKVELTDKSGIVDCMDVLEGLPLDDLKSSGHVVSFSMKGDGDAQVAILKKLVERGVPIRSFEEKRTSIEDVLLGLDGRDSAGGSN